MGDNYRSAMGDKYYNYEYERTVYNIRQTLARPYLTGLAGAAIALCFLGAKYGPSGRPIAGALKGLMHLPSVALESFVPCAVLTLAFYPEQPRPPQPPSSTHDGKPKRRWFTRDSDKPKHHWFTGG